MNITLTFPPALLLGLVVSTILPLLVGLVTKTVTSSSWKAVWLALLAAASGLLAELLAATQAGRPYDFGIGLITALVGFITAVGMHFGLYKPTGLSTKLQRVGMKDAGTAGEGPNDITSLPPARTVNISFHNPVVNEHSTGIRDDGPEHRA